MSHMTNKLSGQADSPDEMGGQSKYLTPFAAMQYGVSLAGQPLRNEEGSGIIPLHELCSTHWRVRANQIAVFTDSYLTGIV